MARTHLARAVTACLLALGSALALTAPASAHTSTAPGTRSLASVLAADGDTFDHNWNDYDITYQAVLAVLAANPKSPVAVLADGTVPLTAFIPTDRAFRRLAHDLTGRWYRSEAKVFSTLATTLGVGTIENVLLYHVVPGATIDYRTATSADGAVLDTALSGATLTVDVHRFFFFRLVFLQDNDPNSPNPLVIAPNINKGNLQIAHGINRVLRPVDL